MTTVAQGAAHRTRGVRLAAPAALGVFVAGATLLVARVDPNRPGHYPTCPLYALTGLYCPLCGGLRATHALAHLDLATAASENVVWLVAAPLLVLAWVAWVVRAWRGTPARELPASAPWVVLGVLVVFAVLRNIPALAPALAP